MFERDAWPRVLPFAIYIAFIVIADMLGRFGVEAPALRWLYGVKIAAVLVALLACRGRYRELAWPGRDGPMLAWAVATGVAVLVLWINLTAGWMVLGSSTGFDPRDDGAIDWLLVALRLSGGALVVPVMEELFWRSFLMRWMVSADFPAVEPRRIQGLAFVVPTLLFGFEHSLWLAGIVAGAAYGWLYIRSGKLWVPIVAHGVTNGLLGIWIVLTKNWSYW